MSYIKKIKKLWEIIVSSTEPKLDELQLEVVENIKNMMSKPDATLLIAPISGICYIEWRQYFIRFGNSAATISNSTYSYYFWLPDVTIERLKNTFYETVEKRRLKLDGDYDKKTLNNLKVIAENIKNN
jgi:hypothetical protein